MNKPTQRARIMAWSVHVFTASGMVAGFKALVAAYSGNIHEAILWLVLSVVIDGIDGTFARMCKVEEVLPRINGKMIDAAIDFVNFVITPTVILYKVKLVPDTFLFPSVIGILYASLYHIGNTDQLTPDNRIKGFPAWWNLIIYYLLVLELNTWVNLVIVVLFIILHFVPVKFIYLSRLQKNVVPAVVALLLLIAANTAILVRFPHAGLLAKIVAVVPLVFLLLLGSFQNIFASIPAAGGKSHQTE